MVISLITVVAAEEADGEREAGQAGPGGTADFGEWLIGRKRGLYICTPMCASARVASSNIVYLSTDIDPRGEVW